MWCPVWAEWLALVLAFGLGLAVQAARQQVHHELDWARLWQLRGELLEAARALLTALPKGTPAWRQVLAVHDRLLLEHGIAASPQAGPAEEVH